MGNTHKKMPGVSFQKGIIADSKGKQFNIDFVGDNNDFVNISYKEPKNDYVKPIMEKNREEIHEICFIEKESILLVGCKGGFLILYKFIGGVNFSSEELGRFQPHEETIIQIVKLHSGLILTLSEDSSTKVLELETLTENSVANPDNSGEKNNENNYKINEIQILLTDSKDRLGENSAIELDNENLIVSQGFFINFFEKDKSYQNENDNDKMQIPAAPAVLDKMGKIYYLAKKIFTNSDNIFFVQTDCNTFTASQIATKTLHFYNLLDYSLNKSIPKIEFSTNRSCMCLINKETLAIGGGNGSIYLISVLKKQLFFVNHFENCDCVSSIKVLENNYVLMGCRFWSTNIDLVKFKVSDDFSEFTEKGRVKKVYEENIKSIKILPKEKIENIDNDREKDKEVVAKPTNQKNYFDKHNIITLSCNYKVKMILKIPNSK